MRQPLDIENWTRKNHYHFFKDFDEPFFGITAQVDATNAYNVSKLNKHSFFLYYLHCALKSANSIEEFKIRSDKDQLYIYDKINASPTVSRPDGTFGFSQIIYHEDVTTFIKEANIEINRVKGSNDLVPGTDLNVIQFSALPWVNFTSISHARDFKFTDTIPKISFGKLVHVDGKKMMSVSVHLNHSIADGYHVGLFFESFQNNLNTKV